ncbi:hypothetical protein D3C75_1337870 [compost metagenome]
MGHCILQPFVQTMRCLHRYADILQPIGNRLLVDLLLKILIRPHRCKAAFFQLDFDPLLYSLEHERRQLIVKFDQAIQGFQI